MPVRRQFFLLSQMSAQLLRSVNTSMPNRIHPDLGRIMLEFDKLYLATAEKHLKQLVEELHALLTVVFLFVRDF